MKRLLPLLLLLASPYPATAIADGCAPGVCGASTITVPGSNTMLLRPEGSAGSAVGYDLMTGRRSFSLPSGFLSADGRVFVSTRRDSRRTVVRRFDAASGALLGSRTMLGTLDGVGISAHGRRVVLAELEPRGASTLAITTGRRDAFIGLPPHYSYEALSPDGKQIYVLHWRRHGGYGLEHYDRRKGRFFPTTLAEPGKKMSGIATSAVTTPNGRWLLTLYAEPDGRSFVHALDLAHGVAHCIDLPLRGDEGTVASTNLILAPDARRLYLASPLLGRVTTIDLRRLRVARVTSFQPLDRRGHAGVELSGAISANGRMLAFGAANRLWLYDTAYGVIRNVQPRVVVTGVGFQPDARRLRVLPWGVFDAATGKRVR